MNKLEYSWELYLAVIASNIAGTLERNELIEVPDDDCLTYFICDLVNEYNEKEIYDKQDMFSYAEEKLIEEFGIKEEDDYE